MFYAHHGEDTRRSVLVTGAAGFIGSHLVDELLAVGCSVTGVDNFDPWYNPLSKRANLDQALRDPAFRLVHADLQTLDLEAVFANVDVVFHLAARPGVQDSWGSGFAAACSQNITMTQQVLEGAAAAGVNRVVYASSSSVYGDGATQGGRTVDPISPYGVSKAAGEQLTKVYGLRGLNVVSPRFFTVFGERQRPDMAMHRLFRAANPADQTIFAKRGSGAQQREFTYVGDVVTAARLIGLNSDSGLGGQTFDVGGGCTTSLNEVIDAVAEVSGTEPAVATQPASPGDPRRTAADIKPIRLAVGWSPTTSLRDGLKAQWEWQRCSSYSAEPTRPLATELVAPSSKQSVPNLPIASPTAA